MRGSAVSAPPECPVSPAQEEVEHGEPLEYRGDGDRPPDSTDTPAPRGEEQDHRDA